MHDKHLLVPLDGSELSASVLPVARMLANCIGADLTLFTSLADSYEPGAAREPVEYLHQVAEAQHALGFDAQIAVRSGDPASRLVELVQESDFDMVVMATHGRSGPARTVFGSVADEIVRASSVPVVLLHPNQHPTTGLRTILVPMDGTPGGALALTAAVPLAQAARATLVLVRVSVPLPLWIYEPNLGLNTGPLIDPMWAEDARRAAEVYVEGVAGRLALAGCDAMGTAISALPASGIVATANDVDADLIVMSTHGRVGAMRSVLGSVADAVVRQSQRPVLLVRRASTAAALAAASLREGSAC